MEQLFEKIMAMLRTFPMLGYSGRVSVRYVDEDVFYDKLKKLMEEEKRTENPA